MISTTHSFDRDIALWYIGERNEGWFSAFCYGVWGGLENFLLRYMISVRREDKERRCWVVLLNRNDARGEKGDRWLVETKEVSIHRVCI